MMVHGIGKSKLSVEFRLHNPDRWSRFEGAWETRGASTAWLIRRYDLRINCH